MTPGELRIDAFIITDGDMFIFLGGWGSLVESESLQTDSSKNGAETCESHSGLKWHMQ